MAGLVVVQGPVSLVPLLVELRLHPPDLSTLPPAVPPVSDPCSRLPVVPRAPFVDTPVPSDPTPLGRPSPSLESDGTLRSMGHYTG